MTDGAGKSGNRRLGREDRLAAQLRENLKRRKAQERARDTASGGRAEAAVPEPATGKDVHHEE